jgi:hypothetical protein
MTTRTNKQTATLEIISPAKALAYLSLSDGNKARKYGINKADVQRLVDLIKSGEWGIADAVCFHESGSLVNAHHRLTAIAESGVTVEMWVKRGLTDADVKALDQGRKRSMADVTGMEKEVVAALNYAIKITLRRPPLVSEVESLAESCFGEALKRLIEFCPTRTALFSAAGAKCGAAYWMIRGNPEYVLNQYRALCTRNYEGQSRIARQFSANAARGAVQSAHGLQALLSALKVYDESCRDHQKIIISSVSTQKFINLVKPIISHA